MHPSSRNGIVVFLAVVALLWPMVIHGSDMDDSTLYKTGVAAFEKRDYSSTVKNMLLLLQKYPDTPLRDVTLFWLAKGSYKIGDFDQAALYMSTLCREYPDTPLKDAAGKELLYLAHAQERGEELVLPPGNLDTELQERISAEKTAVEESHKAALERSGEAQSPSDADREAAKKAAAAKISRVRELLKKRSEEKCQQQGDCKAPI